MTSPAIKRSAANMNSAATLILSTSLKGLSWGDHITIPVSHYLEQAVADSMETFAISDLGAKLFLRLIAMVLSITAPQFMHFQA